MINKKAVAHIELILMITSVFAFSYLMSLGFVSSNPSLKEKNGLLDKFIKKIREPMIKLVSAQSIVSSPSFCCEKTKEGASCVNTNESECADGYSRSPTSCETTSYCRLGTCYDSSEGICLGNTPKNICDEQEGIWDSRKVSEVPQCQLGCCVIADQAAFVPLVRCKKLSTLFGVPNDYRTNIDSELGCIATAQAQDMGACVFETDFERICEFTTRKDCGAREVVEALSEEEEISFSGEKKFYKDMLCSADELGTTCARQASTMCYQGEVYFKDSCGNRENVYSSDKDKSYNSGRIAEPEEICSPNDGSNKNCGNCDYLLGTRCGLDKGFLGGGDLICKKVECVDRDGNGRLNGESWCVYDGSVGNSLDGAGSRHYREVCVDGEVRVEACADYRNEVCIFSSIETSGGNFGTAGCRVNRWQDCVSQDNENDCINIAKRNCNWVPSIRGLLIGGGESGQATGFSNPTLGGSFTGSVVAPITGFVTHEDSFEEVIESNRPEGVCVSDVPPGLNFWRDGTAGSICGQASAKCTVTYEKGLIGGSWKVKDGKECLEENWAVGANRICTALGDCGGYVNYQGSYTDGGFEWKIDGERKEISPNSVNIVKRGFEGFVIAAITGSALLEFDSGNKFVKVGQPCAPGKTGCQDSAVLAKCEDNVWVAEKVCPDGCIGGACFEEEDEGGSQGLGTSGNSVTQTQTPTNEVKAQELLLHSALEMVRRAEDANQEAKEEEAEVNENPLSTAAEKAEAATMAAAADEVLEQAEKTVKEVASIGRRETAGEPRETAPQTPREKYISGLSGQAYTTRFLNWVKPGLVAPHNATGSLIAGLEWAGVAYLGGQLIGGFVGFDSTNTQALSTALSAGVFAYKSIATFEFAAESQLGAIQQFAPAIGIGVAVIVFLAMYKKTKTNEVTFDCMAWQAPVGGSDCESCNDGGLPCSEYRCSSLGQSCEIENAGTEQEICVDVGQNDVNPPVIRPDEGALTTGHKYTNVKNSPPGPGFKIEQDSAECLMAFTSLQFGITTDEPAQCRVDFESTKGFDEMATYFGKTNLFLYNHTEKLVLPSAGALKNSSLVLENGKELNLFIRCQDKNGNANEAEYAVRFCVDPSPDSTPPKIEATSVIQDGCVAEGVSSSVVEFYTNEPAECRWSHFDQDYDSMTEEMVCANELYQLNPSQLFTCRTTLNGITREGTDYYIRCKDGKGKAEADRNVMRESSKFRLRGSTGLRIKAMKPDDKIFGGVSPSPVELYVETLFGCNNGRAVCKYSDNGIDGDYVQFFDTNTEDGIHTQRQDLSEGDYEYFYRCIDAGGNVVTNSTQFTLEIDENPPSIARIYQEDSFLKIITIRKSECSYTLNDCDFSFEEGTLMAAPSELVHVAEWNKENTYHIKCRDEFKNEKADCSAIVKPTTNFL